MCYLLIYAAKHGTCCFSLHINDFCTCSAMSATQSLQLRNPLHSLNWPIAYQHVLDVSARVWMPNDHFKSHRVAPHANLTSQIKLKLVLFGIREWFRCSIVICIMQSILIAWASKWQLYFIDCSVCADFFGLPQINASDFRKFYAKLRLLYCSLHQVKQQNYIRPKMFDVEFSRRK